ALAGLAVPPDGKIPGVRRLDRVDHVQHDHSFLGGHAVLREGAPLGVAPPHPHDDVARGHHFFSLRSSFSSAGIWGSGSCVTPIAPCFFRTTTLTAPNRSSANG